MASLSSSTSSLGEFLSASRARLQPGDIGLPTVGRRRVRGLRREEVAALSGVSVDYYTRLEQGREMAPSAQVADALATALHLGPEGRAHLYRLAGLSPSRQDPVGSASIELRQIVDSFGGAAYVTDPTFRILAANATARALLGVDQLEVGTARFVFLDSSAQRYFANWDDVARTIICDLRISTGYSRPHPGLLDLLDELTSGSSRFTALWAGQGDASFSATRKVINHPEVGRLTLTQQSFEVRNIPGQQLTVATAPSGTPSADALTILSSIHADARGSVHPG